MAVDGNWNITMSTPMGERNATLSLKNSGGTLTGTQGAEGNSAEIFDGTANGDDVAWKVSITNPMPLTLEFTGKVSATASPAKWASARWAAFHSRERGHRLRKPCPVIPGRAARDCHSGRASARARNP